MKKRTWIIGTLLGALVAITTPGCSKGQPAQKSPTVSGVTIDMPKLQQAFANATDAEVRNQVTKVAFGIRYGKPLDSLMALDALAANPAVTEPQKKVVSEIIEQVKQLANQQAAPPSQ